MLTKIDLKVILMPPIQLLGIPTDINSSFIRGPHKAPQSLRQVMVSGMSNLCAENGTSLSDESLFIDRGDVAIDETEFDFERIVTASEEAFSQAPAVFIGGDHFVTWPILTGMKKTIKNPVNLIHIDAHPDIYPDFENNPRSHASPMARIMENSLVQSLTQIGIRTVNDIQQQQIDRYQVMTYPANGPLPTAQQLPCGDCYLSIDVDGLDPAFAPGVSHHEPGGLSVRDVIQLIWAVPGKVIGADIVEYNPDNDINHMTAAVVLKLLKELVAKIHSDRTDSR